MLVRSPKSRSCAFMLDGNENLKRKSPPYRGAHIEVRRQDKMRLASRPAPPPHAAHPPRRRHPALRSRCAPCSRSSLTTVQNLCDLYSRRRAGKVFPHGIDIQETHPSIVNLTVKRRYL